MTSAFYGTRWFAAFPIVFFVGATLYLNVSGAFDSGSMAAAGLVGMMAASFLARDKASYWDAVVEGLRDKTAILVITIFLVVGVYGELMSQARLAEGLIWLADELGLEGAVFVTFTYVACAIFGIATGTSFGTIVTMTPVLFPAAIAMGISPALAGGAILSGAATGDHFAPVSDTTIISASTQRYRSKAGNADIGGVVRSRLLYAIPAFLIAAVLYLLLGSGGDAAGGRELIAEYRHAPGLAMLLPISIVIGFAVTGHSLMQSLTYGIVTGSITGVAAGLLTPRDFVAIENGNVSGILIEGVSGMFPVVLMIMVLMSTFSLMRHYGLMETIVGRLKTLFGRSPRTSELAMFGVAWSLNFVLLGSTGRISVIAGPINDELGAMQRIHPYRRANITDAVVSTFSYFVPWHLWPIIMLSVIEPLAETYDFITTPAPSDFLFTTFYPAVIWVVMLAAVLTGWGRSFEGRNGERIVAWFENTIPPDARVESSYGGTKSI